MLNRKPQQIFLLLFAGASLFLISFQDIIWIVRHFFFFYRVRHFFATLINWFCGFLLFFRLFSRCHFLAWRRVCRWYCFNQY